MDYFFNGTARKGSVSANLEAAVPLVPACGATPLYAMPRVTNREWKSIRSIFVFFCRKVGRFRSLLIQKPKTEPKPNRTLLDRFLRRFLGEVSKIGQIFGRIRCENVGIMKLHDGMVPWCGVVHRLFTGGTIVNRTYGEKKKIHIYLFLRTIFGPIYYRPP